MGYGDGATGLWPTQVKDPLWAFIARLELDLKAAREYAELLERERDEARADVRRYHTLAEHAQEERDRLRALLRDIEREAGQCPLCGEILVLRCPHAPDCRLAAALKEGRDE